MSKPLPREDLEHVLTHARPAFDSLRDARIFLTGGTGFFGHWLLESLLHANRQLALNVRITALTRNAAAFRARSPHITADPALTLLEGDIRTFAFPAGPHTHILHAATDSGGQQASRTPEDLYDDILSGTRRVLHFAQAAGATRLLYTSTGAVYGRSTTLLHTPETFPVPELPLHSYESAKRAAELLCLGQPRCSPVIARCFAFVGPHLPLDAHFAIGNFLGAALKHETIHIHGDGTPRRSWLYMADLAIWLWTMLTHGQPGRAYNVGSGDGMTIAEAATLVLETLSSQPERVETLSSRPEPAEMLSSRPELAETLSSQPERVETLSSRPERSGAERPASGTATALKGTGFSPSVEGKELKGALAPEGMAATAIQIHGTPDPAAPLNSYVPDITRAETELGLTVTVPLTEALLRTAAWHR
jgi:dTDP-glucose 4,6-dehydratase